MSGSGFGADVWVVPSTTSHMFSLFCPSRISAGLALSKTAHAASDDALRVLPPTMPCGLRKASWGKGI